VNKNPQKMATKFGTAQDPAVLDCAICENKIEHKDKMVVEKENS
jgi:hypothetical protein